MATVEVIIKVTSDDLTEHQTVTQRVAVYNGSGIGINPVKEVLQEDEVNYINEIKITAQAEV